MNRDEIIILEMVEYLKVSSQEDVIVMPMVFDGCWEDESDDALDAAITQLRESSINAAILQGAQMIDIQPMVCVVEDFYPGRDSMFMISGFGGHVDYYDVGHGPQRSFIDEEDYDE